MPSVPSVLEPARSRTLLTGLVLLALAMRLPLMGQSIWFDEACMSDQRIGTWSQLLATLYVDIHPPLYVTFMHFWNGVFGDSEVSIRIPPLLCGLATIPVAYLVVLRLAGEGAARWTALLLALSPVHIWYSVEARLYSPMVLCTLVAVGTFHRLLDGPARPRWWLLHAANLLVMTALHYYLAVPILVLGGLALARLRAQRTVALRIVLLHGTALFLLLLFVLAKQALGQFETSQGYLRELTIPELYRFFFQWCWTGNSLPASRWAPATWGHVALQVLGVGLVVRGIVTRSAGSPLLVHALAIPCFLLLVPFVGLPGTYIERSALPALPFFLAMVGAGLASLQGRALYRPLMVLTLVGTVACTVSLYAFGDRRTVYKPHPDWRSAAAYLGAEIDGGGGGRTIFTTYPNPRSLSYYDARIQDERNLAPGARPVEFGEAVSSKLGATLGAYARSTFEDFERHKKELLERAKLRIRGAGDGTVASLEIPEDRVDDVAYLVRCLWHPPRNQVIQTMLTDVGIEVLEAKEFRGVTIHKVRVGR